MSQQRNIEAVYPPFVTPNPDRGIVTEGVLAAIGHTPLVRLTRMFPDAPFQLYAKLEALNPGGSIKDRSAYCILKNALEQGWIQPETTIIESSSGNMGIGLAQACAYLRLRLICVVDTKTTRQNIEILRAYGAEIDLVSEPDPVSGELLVARQNRVQALRRTIPNSWWTDQYANLFNAVAHHQTMAEIAMALEGKVDYLFCATGTCGTLRGCAEYVQAHNLKTRIWAVDAVGSVIFGQPPQKRLIPGHGAARRPELFAPDLAERCIHVSDVECVVGCRHLLKREAILAGGSSGAVISALGQVWHEIPPGATCVVILCDRGERYLDTIYADSWVRQHFGEVDHLWQD
jgi:cysteine synthase A